MNDVVEKFCLTGEQGLLLEAQTVEQNRSLWHQEELLAQSVEGY